MVFKYTFSISGDDLYPEKVLDKIQGDFIAVSHFSPLAHCSLSSTKKIKNRNRW